MTEHELLRRLDIGEDQDTEFKAANSGLPKSLWDTLSAFANTDGGYIVLGVSEKAGSFEITGVKDPHRQLKEFWDGHNNAQKLSTPVCSESDAQVLGIEERRLIILHVPRAQRVQRPVYVNGNPMIGTYKRNFQGDYRCTDAEVRQMLRDAGDEPQDIAWPTWMPKH